MKHLLESKTLSEARREVYAKFEKNPYKILMGRRYTNEEGTEMELCYYMFETKADHEEWLKSCHDEHQINGPEMLRDVNRNPLVKKWFTTMTKLEIMSLLQRLYGCSAETARWVYKNLESIHGKKVIRINE